MRNKIAAGILAILLGGLGVHKFYLGQTGRGILYVVFFWTGIPAIIGFVEGIVILTMSDAAFDARYNHDDTALRSSGAMDAADALVKLKDLRERGIITEEEYQWRRAAHVERL
jgi:TM2 domain-containing membrane protein YozV